MFKKNKYLHFAIISYSVQCNNIIFEFLLYCKCNTVYHRLDMKLAVSIRLVWMPFFYVYKMPKSPNSAFFFKKASLLLKDTQLHVTLEQSLYLIFFYSLKKHTKKLKYWGERKWVKEILMSKEESTMEGSCTLKVDWKY